MISKQYSALYPNYKQLLFEIVDTVFASDVQDSIDVIASDIDYHNGRISYFENKILEFEGSAADARYEKRHTLYFLSSLFDPIIESYERFIGEFRDSISARNLKIKRDSVVIRELDSLITNTGVDSITFIVASHQYDCGGGVIGERLYINQYNEIYQTEYEED